MKLITDDHAANGTAAIRKLSELFQADMLVIEDVRNPIKLVQLIFLCITQFGSEKGFVLAVSQPEINLLCAALLSLRRKNVAVYFPELYDDRPIARNILKSSKSIFLTGIFPSNERAHVFTAKYFKPNRTAIVSNNVYQETIDTAQISKDGIVYAGVIFPSRPLDNVLALARKKFPKMRIDIYGKGDKGYIDAICTKYSCNYMGEYSMRDEVRILSNYKFGLISYPMNSLNNSFCAPNKVHSYNAASCKIICDSPNNLKMYLLSQGLLELC